jgi:hypothetical protein
VVARIPHDLKKEFLSNHGAASVFGIPTPTGSNGTTGYWKEWTESVTANREAWATGFTSGERYVMLSYNPLVPFYTEQEEEALQTVEGLTAYRIPSLTDAANPTFLYDRFLFSVPGRNLCSRLFWSKESSSPGPSIFGGKRLYKFTEADLKSKNTGASPLLLTDIVDAMNSWLSDSGLNRDSKEYVMICLDETFNRELIYPKYKVEYTNSEDIDRVAEIIGDMIFVLRRIKEVYPNCRFGYYNYPRVPKFISVLDGENLYRSFENYPEVHRRSYGASAANVVSSLVQEQDVIYVDAHLHSPSTNKVKTMVDSVLYGVDKLNEYYVSMGKKRKRVFLCTSRLYTTNDKDTPSFFISSDSNMRTYIPEYTVINKESFRIFVPTDFRNTV